MKVEGGGGAIVPLPHLVSSIGAKRTNVGLAMLSLQAKAYPTLF
jgi:hypothetical protein